MDTTVRKRSRPHTTIQIEASMSKYTHDLNLYKEKQYPDGIISLPEFEHLAVERVHVLKLLEQATNKGLKPFSDEWRDSIKSEINKLELTKFGRLLKGYNTQTDLDFEARRVDHISHFILRLAYSRSEELRRWFIGREIEWFKLRFMAQTAESINKFLQENNLTYTPISDSLKDELRDCLIAGTSGMTEVSFASSIFYEVEFSEASSLVKSHRVYLKNGFAYIPASELVVCICTKLRLSLGASLKRISAVVNKLDDPRITDLLTILHDLYTGNHYTADPGKQASLAPKDVDKLYGLHFPMCMRHVHENLKKDHHLKHFSRLQYGLFLKGIGLLYDSAMEFWHDEFTQSMDETKFQKQYAYGFRHMYGKVGGMINYSPYSCDKIVDIGTGASLNYGCPFKHFDKSLLKVKLNEHGIEDADVKEIGELADKSYGLACTKYFECRHGKAPVLPINHPNQYFEESYKLAK